MDRQLSSVSHVVVDEIHERGVNEDLLLIVLKEVLAMRPGLKVILMSATLNAEKFAAFYPGSKPVHIPGYTFPVDVRYLEDALQACQLPFPAAANSVRSHKTSHADACHVIRSNCNTSCSCNVQQWLRARFSNYWHAT